MKRQNRLVAVPLAAASFVITVSLAVGGGWFSPAVADTPGTAPTAPATPTPTVSPSGHTNWD